MAESILALATGRSWRARLTRGAAVLALGALWFAPAFGVLPPLVLYNTSESVPPGLYLYRRGPSPGRRRHAATWWPCAILRISISLGC